MSNNISPFHLSKLKKIRNVVCLLLPFFVAEMDLFCNATDAQCNTM